MKKDKIILSAEHGVLSEIKKEQWAIFERYAKMDLSKFKYSKITIGKHVINRWLTPNYTTSIYEVSTVLPVDKVFKNEGYHVKTKFIFHTYIIKPVNSAVLIYQSEAREGVCHFQIGNKETFIAYESVPLGIVYPDIKEILKDISLMND